MPNNDIILVGDIGGTNTRLAIAHVQKSGAHVHKNGTHVQQNAVRLDNFKKFQGDDYSSLEEIIAVYLRSQTSKPISASLAIAGPIFNQSVKLTNRNWQFSHTGLCEKFGFEHTRLHNDFSAMARSVVMMGNDSFNSFYKPDTKPNSAPIIIAGPGTGFGMGIVIPDCQPPRVLPSEGGHQAYAPQTEDESEILHILQKDHEYVSLELVCSGSGMDMVHQAICTRHNKPYERLAPHTVLLRAADGDAICLEICEIRAAALMGAVGDMVLACGARGGVVLAGGVSERLADYIRAPKAMNRFFNRGPNTDYMKKISVRLLTDATAPLYGAAALFQDIF